MSLPDWVDRKLRKPALPPLFPLWNGEFIGSKVGAATEAMYAHDGTFIKETTAGMDFYNHAKTYTGYAIGSLVVVGLPLLYYAASALYRWYRFREFQKLLQNDKQLQNLKEPDQAENLRHWLRGNLRLFNILQAKGFKDRIWQMLTVNENMGRTLPERLLTLVNSDRGLLHTVLETYKTELIEHFKKKPKDSWMLIELIQGNLFLREAVADFFHDLDENLPQQTEEEKQQKGELFYELNYVRRPWWWPSDFYLPWDARLILGPGGGGLIGATIGTYLLPGLGSALGYIVGAVLGFVISYGHDEFFPRWRANLIHKYYKEHDHPPAFKARRKWYNESNNEIPLYAHLFPVAMSGMGIGLAYGAFGALIGVMVGVTFFALFPYLCYAWRALLNLGQAKDQSNNTEPQFIRKAVKIAWWRRSYWDLPASYRYSFGVMLGTVLGVVFPSTALMVTWTSVLGFTVGNVMAGGLTGGLAALLSPLILDEFLVPFMKRMHTPLTKLTAWWQVTMAKLLSVEIENGKPKRDNMWIAPDIPWYLILAPSCVAVFAVCGALDVSLFWGVGTTMIVGLLHPLIARVIEPFIIFIRSKIAVEDSDAIAWSLRMMGFQSIFAMTATILGVSVPYSVIAGTVFGFFYPYIVGALRTLWQAITPAESAENTYTLKPNAYSGAVLNLQAGEQETPEIGSITVYQDETHFRHCVGATGDYGNSLSELHQNFVLCNEENSVIVREP